MARRAGLSGPPSCLFGTARLTSCAQLSSRGPSRCRPACVAAAIALHTVPRVTAAQVSSPYETLLSAGVCEGSLEVFASDTALRAKLLGLKGRATGTVRAGFPEFC